MNDDSPTAGDKIINSHDERRRKNDIFHRYGRLIMIEMEPRTGFSVGLFVGALEIVGFPVGFSVDIVGLAVGLGVGLGVGAVGLLVGIMVGDFVKLITTVHFAIKFSFS